MAEGDRFAFLLRLVFILFILSKCICMMARDKRGKTPPELRSIVRNLHLETERWFTGVRAGREVFRSEQAVA